MSVAIEGKSEPSTTIPEDTEYKVFKVHTDVEEQGILNTWNEIWSKEKEGQLDRAYTYDFLKSTIQMEILIFLLLSRENSLFINRT